MENLEHDIFLGYRSTSSKHGYIHRETIYLARQRKVVHRTASAIRRCWGLLPPRQTEAGEFLDIPEDIQTVLQLRAYVTQHKRHWLYGRQGENVEMTREKCWAFRCVRQRIAKK